MWGSTKANTASECTWQNAPFNNHNTDYDEEYFNSVKDSVCPNNVLAKEYDAATQIMGGDWRMPTQDEFQELLDNTDKLWTTINGVYGRKFTSKTDESKYIFIPVAGYCKNGSFDHVGHHGRVWSSSLYASGPYRAWGLRFDSAECITFYNSRYFGWSVRGVL